MKYDIQLNETTVERGIRLRTTDDILLEYRAKGWTHQRIADKVGVNRSTVSRWLKQIK